MTDLVLCLAILTIPVAATLVFMARAASIWQTTPSPDINAARRAQELLEKTLPAEQLKDLAARGYLSIGSGSVPGREYRIWNSGGPVEVYEAGRYAMSLCVEPTEPLPPADLVLMHKLMIEGQEEEYLRIANRLGRAVWLGRTGRRRGMPY